jgi:RsiW-degrading membrane proteinase PrsW (M82 family)
MFIYYLLLAIIPPLFLGYYIYKNDLFDKEPIDLVVKSFFGGCLIVVPIYFIEVALHDFTNNIFLYTLIGVALIEEGFKYLLLIKFFFPLKDFDEPYDGIFYSVMISLGFAAIENIKYVLFDSNPGTEFTVAFLRMFTAIPLHATCGVIMGYYVGLSKFKITRINENKFIKFFTNPKLIGLFLAILIHTFYDYFLFLGEGVIFSFVTLGISVYLAKKAIKLHQQNSPYKDLN